MKGKLSTLGCVLILGALIVSGCGPATAQPTELPTATPTEATAEAPATAQPTEAPVATPTEVPTKVPPTKQPTQVPTATPTEAAVEAPDEVRAARDVALAYVSGRYGEQAPALGLTWTEEFITPEGLVGSGTYQYTAEDWVVTITYPLVAPEAVVYQVVVANPTTGFQWEGEVNAVLQVTETLAPTGRQPVVGWPGRVVSLPAGSQFDDYLALEPEGAGEVGLTGADNTVEAQIQMLRDSTTYAHLWGTLTCPVLDYGGCQLVVTRLREDRPGPSLAPDPVEGWEGIIVSFPPGSQFDDHFLLAGDFAVGYGIDSPDPTLAAQLAGLRDTQTTIRVWGKLICPTINAFGTGISVNRIEVVGELPAPALTPTETLAPTAGQPVACWYGRVDSTPDDSPFDDYLVLLPEELRRAVGLTGADEAIEAEIESLRDSGTYAHFWGALTCDVPDYGGCQLLVTRLRPEGPEGPFFDPEAVEGWTGSISSTPDDAQFDDYFVRSGSIPVRYGIDSSDAAIAAQLESLRDTGTIVRVWGQVTCPAIDVYGTQIQVARIEVAMEAPTEEEGYEGWNTYMSERFGYALRYPGECTVMGSDLDESVQFVGPVVDNEHWPWFFVDHYDSDFYHPPAGTDVHQWIADSGHPYGEIGPEVEVAGLPTAHFIYEGGPGVYDSDHYFLIRGDQLFHIMILHAGGQQDWDLYDKFLQSFVFPSEAAAPPVEPASDTVDGWVGTIVKLPPGSQLDGYFERDDGQRFGIDTVTDSLRARLEEVRWTGAQIEVWGQLLTGIPAYEGQLIQVERLETVSGPAQEPRNLSPFAFASASSALPSDRWSQYWAWSAIDGLLETAWVEEGHRGHEPWPSGPGIGEWIMLTFPEAIEVHRIGVDVGFDRDADIFPKNNRLKRATIVFSKGEHIELAFSDTRGVQIMDIPPVKTTYVQVVIDEVYPGSKYDDTCLAEIEVWGRTQ